MNSSIGDLDESMASLFNVIQNKLSKAVNKNEPGEEALNTSHFKLDLTFDNAEEDIGSQGAKNLNKRLHIKVTTDVNILQELKEEEQTQT